METKLVGTILHTIFQQLMHISSIFTVDNLTQSVHNSGFGVDNLLITDFKKSSQIFLHDRRKQICKL